MNRGQFSNEQLLWRVFQDIRTWAYRYKNAMIARRIRTVNWGRADNPTRRRRARLKPLSDTEYAAWLVMFHDEIERHKNEKAGAVLRDDKDKIIEEAGRRLLEETRPQGYVSKKGRKAGDNFLLVLIRYLPKKTIYKIKRNRDG